MPCQCLGVRLLVVTLRALAPLALVVLAGCGESESSPNTGSTAAKPTATAAPPALSTRPAGPGEFVVRGESSPATDGPYAFKGRYLVRFEQYAPEDPALDFTGQTPLVATLTPRGGDPRGAIKLFEAAAPSGRRELELDGRLYVDVSFGDFPYVVRFTPRT